MNFWKKLFGITDAQSAAPSTAQPERRLQETPQQARRRRQAAQAALESKNTPPAQPVSAEYECELYDDWVHVREGIISGLQAKGVEITDDVARQAIRASLDIVVERRNLHPGLLAGIINRRFGKSEGSDRPANDAPPFRGVFTGSNLDGLWVRDEADTKNPITIATWCMMKGASSDIIARASTGSYRVIRSTKHGGWFCMFGPPALDPD